MKDLFTATPAEREIIERIAKRAADIMRRFISPDRRMGEDDIMMYLEACHCNGCPCGWRIWHQVTIQPDARYLRYQLSH